jgi:hypothetical protein
LIRLRHGEHLDDDQLKSVRTSVQRALASADRLRRFKLVNADEPDFVARADVP